MSDDFFAPPPFKPAETLIQLKRSLRALHPLAERGNGFDWQGSRVIELESDAQTIIVRLAKQPARTPEFETRLLKNSADLRRCVDDVKKRLATWTEE